MRKKWRFAAYDAGLRTGMVVVMYDGGDQRYGNVCECR